MVLIRIKMVSFAKLYQSDLLQLNNKKISFCKEIFLSRKLAIIISLDTLISALYS